MALRFGKIFGTILFLVSHSKLLLCVKTKIECGYKQCPVTREGALNVHLIPHSHMDAGWVKTFDEYYYGTKTSVSSANVQLIFHSVLSELLHDKRRKFTFSETAFFWRWWKEQRPTTRATFRSLVQEGRVEFAGGGWTHADSATVSYLQTLDLWTWGLRKLNDTLGPCGKPKAAWQIDTYGHTREQASLLAQMGFDGLFLGRVDHKEREEMMEEDRMEFMWRGSDVLGKMSDIMSHAMFNLYNAPNGFCFDWLCGDEPIVDDLDSPTYNANARVNEFITQIERQAKYYDHDNILVTMGGDFTYQNAANWFMNMDKLINHVNTHPANLSDINIFYSTPSCYLKALYLYGRRDKAIYTEKGDFLPYGSDASTYWTGFYSSRPSTKYFAKKAHTFLQVLKQISVIAKGGDSYELHLLRHAVGLMMHHDAITGTSQQHVTNDFIKILSEAVDVCTKKLSNLLSYLTPTWGGSRRAKGGQQFIMCHELNISQCRFAETQESLLILVYNPLSVKTYHYIRLPAIALHYSIRDYNDEETEYQLSPLPSSTINLGGRSSKAIQELWFEAENIPPLGYTAFYLTPIRDQLEENQYKKGTSNNDAEAEMLPYISNEYLKVTVNKSTGILESIQHADGMKILVAQNFFVYPQGRQGLQSGTYSFRPSQPRPNPVTDHVQYNTIRGTLVKEIRQRFTDWISQVIRLYRGEEMVEFEWTVGPVPIGTDLGKEVVTIFKTNISSGDEFFTDSNGRQMMKRTCWNETAIQQQKKPVAACYYPVTSRICINSHNTSVGMCVLTDRTQGGTSYNDGEIELMVHRRLLTDDGFGLEEPLNEEAFGAGLVVRGTHRIFFGALKMNAQSDELTWSERMSKAARRWDMEPWLFFTSGDKITASERNAVTQNGSWLPRQESTTGSDLALLQASRQFEARVNRRKWQNVRNKRYSALRHHGLPAHIHILTLEPWKGGSVLLRLENTIETTKRGTLKSDPDAPEDPKYHITVDLSKIFMHHKIKMVRETTLAANQWLDDARQMDWSTRYVYAGGDDGILPEDIPEEEDKSVRVTEMNTSVEEQDYMRKQQSRRPDHTRPEDKSRTNMKFSKDDVFSYDRKKRAVNDSVNIYDNVINDTVKDFKIDTQINESIETPKITEIDIPIDKIDISMDKIDEPITKINIPISSLNNYDTPITEVYKLKNSSMRNVKRVRAIPKLSFWNKPGLPRSKHPFWDFDDEDYASSEEDALPNLKKRSPKRKPTKTTKEVREEVQIDDSDDGITKSMYDMYYKPFVPRNPFRRPKPTQERRSNRQKKVKRQDNGDEESEYMERSKRLNKGRKDRPGSFLRSERINSRVPRDSQNFGSIRHISLNEDSTLRKNIKRRGVDTTPRVLRRPTQDMDYSEEDDDYDEDEEERRRMRRNRHKRTLTKDDDVENSSEQESNEVGYKVTLRPTQIRTFVIWFESHRKIFNN